MDSKRDVIREEAVARVVPQGRRLGLVVGIDAYRVESGIPPLRAAVADAAAIHAVMVDPQCGRFPQDLTVLLNDDQATDTNIRIALERLSKTATSADEVWFFYAGHALIVDGEHRLLPINARREYLDATSVDFPALFRKIRCRRKIVILDCCHAGATDMTTRNVHDVEEILRNYQASGTVTYCSSDGDQKSVELPEQGRGAFSYWLEKGLRGAADVDGSGIVTSDELWRYVCEHVERDALRLTGRKQTPRLKLDSTGSFALTVNIAALRAREEAQRQEEAEQRAKAERFEAHLASLRQLLGDDDYANLSTDELKAARTLLQNEPAARATQEIIRALDSFRVNKDGNAAVLQVRGVLVSARSSSNTPPGHTGVPRVEPRVPERFVNHVEKRSGRAPADEPPVAKRQRASAESSAARAKGPAAGASSERRLDGSETQARDHHAGTGPTLLGVPTPSWVKRARITTAIGGVLLLILKLSQSAGEKTLPDLSDTSAAPALPAPTTVTTHVVKLLGDGTGYYFEPKELRVRAGDAVKFVMVSGAPHNVAFDASKLPAQVQTQLRANMQSSELSSPFLMGTGEEYTISFAGVAAGTYDFICIAHLAMGQTGRITVSN